MHSNVRGGPVGRGNTREQGAGRRRAAGHRAALLILGLGMLGPALARPLEAQVILNAEQLQPRDTSGLQFALQGELNLKAGNAQLTDLAGAGAVGYRVGPNWIRLIVGGEHLSGASQSITDSRYAHLRYSYIFSRRLRTFHFWQIQSNRSLLLKRRVLLGSGLRYALLTGPLSLDVGSGLMLEFERAARSAAAPNDVVSTRALRLANLAVLRHDLATGASATVVLYYQPNVVAMRDYRALADVTLASPVAWKVSLALSLEWRHDSRPPIGLRRDDLDLKTGLQLK